MKKRSDGRFCRKIKINNKFVFFYSSEATEKQAARDIEQQLIQYRDKEKNGKLHLKLNGYAPKYSIEYLKNINTGEKQKASHSKNDLLNGGGEGEI